MAADNRSYVLSCDFERTDVTCHADHFLHVAQVPPSQVNLMDAVEDASATGLFASRIISPVIDRWTPLGKIRTGVHPCEKNAPDAILGQQLLHARGAGMEPQVAAHHRDDFFLFNQLREFSQPQRGMRQWFLYKNMESLPHDARSLLEMKVRRSRDHNKIGTPSQSSLDFWKRSHRKPCSYRIPSSTVLLYERQFLHTQ